MLLHNPIGVGWWVASYTHGSKNQGKEKIRQDAPNDDQHVDPSLQDKKSRGDEHALIILQPGKICSVEETAHSKQWVNGVTTLSEQNTKY